MIGSVTSNGCDLYYEEAGEGGTILLVHPAGATASTWGPATDELARIGRVITYDRRGYARTGGEPARSMSTHTADAAALLEYLGTAPAVVVGTSAGSAIAVDLAVRRPDLVRAVIAHEFPWRFTHHLPTGSQVAALAKIGSLALRGRQSDAAEALPRSAYSYRDGGSAWDAFPEEWRRIGRENARAALADFRNSIGEYPSAADLATVEVPVVCTYGARSPNSWISVDCRSRFAGLRRGVAPSACAHGAASPAPWRAEAHGVVSSGVALAAPCPGGVTTEFAHVAGVTGTERRTPAAPMIGPEECARAGLDGLEHGRRIVMPRRAVRALAWFGARSPRVRSGCRCAAG